jgi:alpha-galactosidase
MPHLPPVSTDDRTRRRRRRGVSGLTAATLIVGLAVAVPMTVEIAAAPAANALANGLARTPQMGWNDWNAFGCNVDAKLVEQTADTMISNGMKAAGYKYVNIDDCWLEKQRDANGNLVPDPTKFPNGIKAVAKYVHSKGLKLGIYEDAGTATCAGYPGSLGHEKQDAATFASWGVDYLKYDNCNNAGSTTKQQYIDRYRAMRDALSATGRKIFYSLCEWGDNDPWTWAPKIGNSWRTTGDIQDNYSSMLSIFNQNVWLYPYSHPGAWNDPDMLEVGNGGMTTTEYRSEFSLWAAMDAPLIAGTDLRTISKPDLKIYTNKRVIAVDQDPLGKQAVPVAVGGEPAGDNGLWVLSKPLANGDRAVVLFNSNDSTAKIHTTAAEVGMPKAKDYVLRNLWSKKTTESAGKIVASVPAHGTVMYRVSKGAPKSAAVGPDVVAGISGVPSTITVNNPTTVHVSLTNYGRTTVKQAALSLAAPKGWTVKSTGRTLFRKISTNKTVKAAFTVTASKPKQPLKTGRLTGKATYAWKNGQGSASAGKAVQVATPVQAPYSTYSSATDAPAEYGQVGNRFAVSGAGNDLWSGSDNYTTIYRQGVVGTSSTVVTEVKRTANLSGYGKTGILVRNSIPSANTAPEGVILLVSPAGGIQMEWDDNAGQYIDAVSPANGTIGEKVPVYLKLVRSGSTYTGYYSTDGSTWTQVASETVPGQADTQDAGMFVTSHASGSPARTTFSGFSVS